MRKVMIAAVASAPSQPSPLAAYSQAQQPAPNNNVKVYYTTPLDKDPSRFVRLQRSRSR